MDNKKPQLPPIYAFVFERLSFKPKLSDYLQHNHPELYNAVYDCFKKLENYISKIEDPKIREYQLNRLYEYSNNVSIDFLLPFIHGGVIGGYYNIETEETAINPMLIGLDDKYILLNTLVHEAMHYLGLKDEAAAQSVTGEFMSNEYGVIVDTGYDHIVAETNWIFKQARLSKVLEYANQPEKLFEFIVEEVLYHSAIKKEINPFNPQAKQLIQMLLTSKWNFITEHFHRLINYLDHRDVNPFEKAVMDLENYNFTEVINGVLFRIVGSYITEQ